jgi:hypothetical protein
MGRRSGRTLCGTAWRGKTSLAPARRYAALTRPARSRKKATIRASLQAAEIASMRRQCWNVSAKGSLGIAVGNPDDSRRQSRDGYVETHDSVSWLRHCRTLSIPRTTPSCPSPTTEMALSRRCANYFETSSQQLAFKATREQFNICPHMTRPGASLSSSNGSARRKYKRPLVRQFRLIVPSSAISASPFVSTFVRLARKCSSCPGSMHRSFVPVQIALMNLSWRPFLALGASLV